jgi:hypothetical protein
MTVIVGILCSDGVVIGSDSAMAAGRLHTGYTIERQEGDVLKIEIIERNVITAGTGAMGLAQRFNDRVEATIKELRAPFQPAQNFIPALGFIGSKVQQIFTGKAASATVTGSSCRAIQLSPCFSSTASWSFPPTRPVLYLRTWSMVQATANFALATFGTFNFHSFEPSTLWPNKSRYTCARKASPSCCPRPQVTQRVWRAARRAIRTEIGCD